MRDQNHGDISARTVHRVAVTGATGFVGRGLRTRMERTGIRVVEIGRAASVPDAEFFCIDDLGPETDFGDALPGCDAVVHLAARVHMMRDTAVSPLAACRAVNLHGSINLARQAAAAGIRRFVYLSSVKVNGELGAFCEDDNPAPQDAYAQSKMEAEQELLSIARETAMEVVIVRPPLVYGRGVKGNFATLVRWVRLGVPLPFGAADNRRSLVALDNLVDFIALCADRERSPCAANEIFLVSDGDDVSTAELLRRVAHAYGVRSRLVPVPVDWLRIGARMLGKTAVIGRLLDSLTLDISKARERLGWEPVISMEEQLRKMACDDTGA